ncbi:TetR/AcrR family transcriptional regulator C-terminal domain-containing protein [Salinisphaera sp.]|uniref:TetR/AcrR family transcriptional regulator C-terminal domain-containing protein n=1 Tax=Salinisphaera sp. TaxID=1914330 RepID=UPI002D78498B|nr:TetR/AcrR family transcriptional regulator C-terminal domain-containing protein [Salinisphaera sp.]HET7315371.1 TetR/AcrR family transcriptional regulator C-terminal domain-containing protein [Salinisphaera sp.]
MAVKYTYRRAADRFPSLLRGDPHTRILLGHAPGADQRDPAIAEAVATFVARYRARADNADRAD